MYWLFDTRDETWKGAVLKRRVIGSLKWEILTSKPIKPTNFNDFQLDLVCSNVQEREKLLNLRKEVLSSDKPEQNVLGFGDQYATAYVYHELNDNSTNWKLQSGRMIWGLMNSAIKINPKHAYNLGFGYMDFDLEPGKKYEYGLWMVFEDESKNWKEPVITRPFKEWSAEKLGFKFKSIKKVNNKGDDVIVAWLLVNSDLFKEYKLVGFRVYRAPLHQPDNWTLMELGKMNKKTLKQPVKRSREMTVFRNTVLYTRLSRGAASVFIDTDLDVSKSYIYKFVPVDEFWEERPEAAIEGVYAPE